MIWQRNKSCPKSSADFKNGITLEKIPRDSRAGLILHSVQPTLKIHGFCTFDHRVLDRGTVRGLAGWKVENVLKFFDRQPTVLFPQFCFSTGREKLVNIPAMQTRLSAERAAC